jgi:hypothetical protein
VTSRSATVGGVRNDPDRLAVNAQVGQALKEGAIGNALAVRQPGEIDPRGVIRVLRRRRSDHAPQAGSGRRQRPRRVFDDQAGRPIAFAQTIARPVVTSPVATPCGSCGRSAEDWMNAAPRRSRLRRDAGKFTTVHSSPQPRFRTCNFQPESTAAMRPSSMP